MLGDNTASSSGTPVDVSGLTGAIAIAGDLEHTCALTSAGGVKCWGVNLDGQLGDGTAADRSAPVDVLGVGGTGLLTGVRAIGAGHNDQCAVTSTGGVLCWGRNLAGQLGDGTLTDSRTPVAVRGAGGVGQLTDIKAVAGGYGFTCALTNAGGVKCWGSGVFGQLGNGTLAPMSANPVNVSGLGSGVVAIGAGMLHACAVLSSGGVKCWGYGADGQIGNNTFEESNTVPRDVVGVGNAGLLTGVAAISLGYYHTCALMGAGEVKCWGSNGEGALGDGTDTSSSTPVDVSGLTGVSAIGTGSHHTCAVTNAGTVKCWGRGTSGALGDGLSTSSHEPVTAAPIEAMLFGEATFSTNALAAGSRSITAAYVGNHDPSTSEVLTQVVVPHATSTSVTSSSSPSPTVFGQSVTFTATVTGAGTPTGTVTFLVNNVAQAPPVALSGGTATFTTAALPAGVTHSVTAVYNGDSTHATSSSSYLHTVGKGGTTTALANAPSPSIAGQSVTFTATVAVPSPAAGTPSGTVTFSIDGVDQDPVAVSGGEAILTTELLSVGSHSITAEYNGDGSFNGSASSAVGQEVNLHSTAIALSAAPNPSVFGQSVTFTAEVTSAGGTPTGMVQFWEGITNYLGGASLSGGIAALKLSSLSVNSHGVTAYYESDGIFGPSNSTEATQTVNKGETTTTLTSAPTSGRPGAIVQFTATVAASAPAAGIRTGTVEFRNGVTPIGTVTLSGGTASLSTAALPIGANQLTAAYSGDANFAASASASRVFTVDARVGAELRISTHGTSPAHLKQFPAVARLANNTFAVVWESKDQDGSGFGVYAQRQTATGAKASAEFRANTFMVNAQQQPSIGGLTNGFVVVWASLNQDGSGWGIYGQRYNVSGVKLGAEFRVNTATANQQWQPSVAGLKAGGFVVTWASNLQDGSGYGVFGQRYNANGVKAGGEFRINTTTASNQWTPRAAPLENGGFVVIWSSNAQTQFAYDIFGQAYTGTGVKAGLQFLVNTVRVKDQTEPSVAGLKDGGFVVAWTSRDQDGSGLGVYGQRFNASRGKAGGEFRVNTAVGNNQSQPSVAAFADRGFAIVWTSQGQDGSGNGVYAQAYNATGQRVQAEFRVNTTSQSDQWQAEAAAFSAGDFFAAWSSKNPATAVPGIYGQRLKVGGL